MLYSTEFLVISSQKLVIQATRKVQGVIVLRVKLLAAVFRLTSMSSFKLHGFLTFFHWTSLIEARVCQLCAVFLISCHYTLEKAPSEMNEIFNISSGSLQNIFLHENLIALWGGGLGESIAQWEADTWLKQIHFQIQSLAHDTRNYWPPHNAQQWLIYSICRCEQSFQTPTLIQASFIDFQTNERLRCYSPVVLTGNPRPATVPDIQILQYANHHNL